MSWELRKSVGEQETALLEAKWIGTSECNRSVEVPPLEAFATTAPTTIADKKIVPSKTMDNEDRFIKFQPRCGYKYYYFRELRCAITQYIGTDSKSTKVPDPKHETLVQQSQIDNLLKVQVHFEEPW